MGAPFFALFFFVIFIFFLEATVLRLIAQYRKIKEQRKI